MGDEQCRLRAEVERLRTAMSRAVDVYCEGGPSAEEVAEEMMVILQCALDDHPRP